MHFIIWSQFVYRLVAFFVSFGRNWCIFWSLCISQVSVGRDVKQSHFLDPESDESSRERDGRDPTTPYKSLTTPRNSEPLEFVVAHPSRAYIKLALIRKSRFRGSKVGCGRNLWSHLRQWWHGLHRSTSGTLDLAFITFVNTVMIYSMCFILSISK